MSCNNVIIIPVDGSTNSDRAINWYLEHLHLEGDRVVFIHAFDPPPMQAAKHTSVDFKNSYDEWCILIQKAQDKARSIFKKYDEQLTSLKGKLSYKLISDAGNPGAVIVSHIKKENASSIVMGCRGMGKLRRTLLGSVSDYVVRHSSVPVIVVPPL